MTDLRTAAQQMLEAWQTATYGHPSHHKATLLAMTALRSALAQQAEGGGNLPPPLQVPPEVAATLTTTDIAWLETRRLTKLWHELGQMRWAGADEGWDRAIEAVRSRLNDECQAVLAEQAGCETEGECTQQPWCRISGECQQRKQAEPVAAAVAEPVAVRCPRCWEPMLIAPPQREPREFVCSTGLCHYRRPLTDEQLWASDEIMSLNADLGWHMDTIRMFARAIERAHGIAPASAPKEAP